MVCIKNRTCCYFDDIIRLEDFNIDIILIDKKPHKTILIYVISYTILISQKPLRIRFDKRNGFIRIYDGTRYLLLFGSEKYDDIFNRIKYLISLKSSITYVFSHYYAKTNVDFYNCLPIEKVLTLHNVVILIQSVFINQDRNHYYYNILFLEICSYQPAKK